MENDRGDISYIIDMKVREGREGGGEDRKSNLKMVREIKMKRGAVRGERKRLR